MRVARKPGWGWTKAMSRLPGAAATMKVRIYPGSALEEFGAVRWDCEWQELKPSAKARIESAVPDTYDRDIDPDTDLIWCHQYYRSLATAKRAAKKIWEARSNVIAYSVCIQKQAVDWFIEEDQLAEWVNVGEPTYID